MPGEVKLATTVMQLSGPGALALSLGCDEGPVPVWCLISNPTPTPDYSFIHSILCVLPHRTRIQMQCSGAAGPV